MLLFILGTEYEIIRESLFQYISCYCLSNPITRISVPEHYFNTSHVTVYHQYHAEAWRCISISIHLMLLFIAGASPGKGTDIQISIHLMLLFIGIKMLPVRSKTYFNTSHVTVYPLQFTHMNWNGNDFNTSHVTVYQEEARTLTGYKLFQYISCYCLSCSGWRTNVHKHISIHLMLLFIGKKTGYRWLSMGISIHLMLLFIKKK